MRDPFLEQLSDLCRAHVTRAKWVFVPSHAVGRTLGERIALEGTNWLNLRCVTPLDIALRMGAPLLVERGIDPSEEGLGPALMMRLLLDLPAFAPERYGGATRVAEYFGPLANQPTMAQALWTTVRELRMAGMKSSDLRGEAFESADKHAELQTLLASYEKFLKDNSRGDMATVYEEAMLHPDWCPIQREDCWTELPDTIWSPLQRRLIDAMPGERIVPKVLRIPGATVPRRIDAGSRPDAGKGRLQLACERIAADRGSQPLAFLLAPGTAHSALRVPAASTRPGRALIGFCDWIESDFSAGHLRRLLQSGDMSFAGERAQRVSHASGAGSQGPRERACRGASGGEAPRHQEDEGVTAGQAARTLAGAGYKPIEASR